MAKRPPSIIRPGNRKRDWSASPRGTAEARGYGNEWRKLRAQVLADEPLCRTHRLAGRSVVAVTVDHIRPKHLGGTDERSNLQPLCKPCHKAKTAAESAAQRRLNSHQGLAFTGSQ